MELDDSRPEGQDAGARGLGLKPPITRHYRNSGTNAYSRIKPLCPGWHVSCEARDQDPLRGRASPRLYSNVRFPARVPIIQVIGRRRDPEAPRPAQSRVRGAAPVRVAALHHGRAGRGFISDRTDRPWVGGGGRCDRVTTPSPPHCHGLVPPEAPSGPTTPRAAPEQTSPSPTPTPPPAAPTTPIITRSPAQREATHPHGTKKGPMRRSTHRPREVPATRQAEVVLV